MVECDLPKVDTRVRFPSAALFYFVLFLRYNRDTMKELNLTVLQVLERWNIHFTEHDLQELLEQERILRFDAFSKEDEERIMKAILRECEPPVTAVIWNLSDNTERIESFADNERGLKYARWKAKTAVLGRHSSLTMTAMAALGKIDENVFERKQLCMPRGGAFPVFVNDELKAVIAVSGQHYGMDHEILIRVLEHELGRRAPYHGPRF